MALHGISFDIYVKVPDSLGWSDFEILFDSWKNIQMTAYLK